MINSAPSPGEQRENPAACLGIGLHQDQIHNTGQSAELMHQASAMGPRAMGRASSIAKVVGINVAGLALAGPEIINKPG